MSDKETYHSELESRCCQSGCPGCPWGYTSDTETPAELLLDQKDTELTEIKKLQEEAEKYLNSAEN